MAKLKKENVPFTQIANDVLSTRDLSFKAKGMYAYLFSKPDGWDFSGERIIKESKDGKDAVYSGLAELESVGYLIRKKLKTGRIDYFLKHSLGQNPVPEKPEMEPVPQFPEKESISNKDIYIYPTWLNMRAWLAWMEYKKQKKQKMTILTIKLQMKKLEANKKDHVAMIKQSIENGWTGLFPLKTPQPFDDKASRRSDFARAHEKRIADEEERAEREAAKKDNDARNILNEVEDLSAKFKVKA